MSPNNLFVWLITIASLFCLLLSAFTAAAAYRIVIAWLEREDRHEAAQLNNPAGRVRRRTVRNHEAGGDGQQVGLNGVAAVRARQKAPQGISRSLADAMVQTSLTLFGGSARSANRAEPGLSIRRSATPVAGPSAAGADPVPSAPRPDAPGPSTSRVDAPGPSVPRPHAPRPPTPGPSAPRSAVRDAFASPLAMPTTPGSSSRRGVASPITRHVRKFTPRGKVKQEPNHLPAVPSPVVVSFYQPDDLGDGPIEAPPNLTHDPELSLGDLFYYVMRDGSHQLWLWSVDRNGQAWWKPVDVGYQREDGKWLLITPHYKLPGWVTWDRFTRVFDLSASSSD